MTEKLSMASLLEAVVHVPDPRDRLRRIRSLRTGISDLSDRLRAALAEAIAELRAEEPRPTWDEIGELLGVSAQRAEQLSRTVNRPEEETLECPPKSKTATPAP